MSDSNRSSSSGHTSPRLARTTLGQRGSRSPSPVKPKAEAKDFEAHRKTISSFEPRDSSNSAICPSFFFSLGNRSPSETPWENSTFGLSLSEIDNVARSPLFGEKVASKLQTEIDKLPPSPKMNSLPTPNDVPTLNLDDEDILDITRTPLMTSVRKSQSRVKFVNDDDENGSVVSAVKEQSTPLSANKANPFVESDEGEIKPRKLVFDDDDDNDNGVDSETLLDKCVVVEEEKSEEHKGHDIKVGEGDERTRAATKIQAVWRGHCARMLYKEACAYADELIAAAMSIRKTDLDPLDLSWCFPVSSDDKGPQPTQKAPSSTVQSGRKSSSNKTEVTSSKNNSSVRVDLPCPVTVSVSQSFRLPRQSPSQLPPLPKPSVVPPRNSFQSSSSGTRSECSTPANNRSYRSLTPTQQEPMSAKQQRSSMRRSIDRSDSYSSIQKVQPSTGSRATTARAQRLMASDVPASRSKRDSTSGDSGRSWNFY